MSRTEDDLRLLPFGGGSPEAGGSEAGSCRLTDGIGRSDSGVILEMVKDCRDVRVGFGGCGVLPERRGDRSGR